MPATKKLTREEMIQLHESPDYDPFESDAEVEFIAGPRNPPAPPMSIRLGAPLLEALDKIAAREHRKRSNLIQHILWEYVHSLEAKG